MIERRTFLLGALAAPVVAKLALLEDAVLAEPLGMGTEAEWTMSEPIYFNQTYRVAFTILDSGKAGHATVTLAPPNTGDQQ